MEIILFALLAVVAFNLFQNNKTKKRNNNLVKILTVDKEADSYIQQLDVIINDTTRKKQKAYYQFLQTYGYLYKGQFALVRDAYKRINQDVLPEMIKISLMSNHILALLFSGNLEEGQDEITKNKDLLCDGLSMQNAGHVQTVNAVAEYYFHDKQLAYKMFKQLLRNPNRDQFFWSIDNYYLGLITREKNRLEESKEYFEDARTMGSRTFIADRAEIELKSL